MDHNQIFVLAIANVPTMITVLIGILINNTRINDLNSRIVEANGTLNSRIVEANGTLNSRIVEANGTLNARISSVDSRMASLENRFTNLENKFDTRFELLLNKVVDVDNRLTRIEA